MKPASWLSRFQHAVAVLLRPQQHPNAASGTGQAHHLHAIDDAALANVAAALDGSGPDVILHGLSVERTMP
jgi:hypothetical protein